MAASERFGRKKSEGRGDMREVEWTDEHGYRRVVLLRSGDDDPRIGIPVGPPDLRELDWDEFRRELNNILVDRGLLTWNNVVEQQNGLRGAILQAMSNKLSLLYKRAKE